MQCKDFETRLNQLLDRRERPEIDDALIAHSARCESCRELLCVQELLFDGLELMERPEPAPGFSRRAVADAVTPRRAAWPSPSRWVVLAASLAAVLVVAAVVGPRLLPERGDRIAGPQKPAKTGRGLPGATALVNPGRPSKPEQARPPVPAPVSGEALANQEYRRVFEQIPQRLPEVQRDALETVEQIPGGLRPIATSFGVAVGLIRNTLPRGKEENPLPKPQAACPLNQAFIV